MILQVKIRTSADSDDYTLWCIYYIPVVLILIEFGCIICIYVDPLIHAFHGFKFDIGLLVRCVFNGSDSNVVTQRMI